jgi:hypothetical protein
MAQPGLYAHLYTMQFRDPNADRATLDPTHQLMADDRYHHDGEMPGAQLPGLLNTILGRG